MGFVTGVWAVRRAGITEEIVMANVDKSPETIVGSPGSDDTPWTIHERMSRIIQYNRIRVERYMLKHDIPLPVVHGRTHDWSASAPTPSSPRQPLPIVAESFLDGLTEDIVLSKLWPLLMEHYPKEDILASSWPMQMEGFSWVSIFQTNCALRCVCRAWKEFVESRPEWETSLEWWSDGLHRLPLGQFEDPLSTSDKSSEHESSEYETTDYHTKSDA